MDTIKYLRSKLERRVARAREVLAEGWRELLNRSNTALTHFAATAKHEQAHGPQEFPRWSLLAAETWETALAVIIRVEIPGIKKDDVQVEVVGSFLRIRGDKRSGGDQQGRLYHLTERAYGLFERSVPLPDGIDPKQVEVSYQDGVITVILQKTRPVPPRRAPAL